MIITYLKCAWENPFTRVGYILLVLPFVFGFRPYFLSGLEFFVSALCLFGSTFGRGTVVGYIRTQKHIRKFGQVRWEFMRLMGDGGYCVRLGVVLALKEEMKRQPRAQE